MSKCAFCKIKNKTICHKIFVLFAKPLRGKIRDRKMEEGRKLRQILYDNSFKL